MYINDLILSTLLFLDGSSMFLRDQAARTPWGSIVFCPSLQHQPWPQQGLDRVWGTQLWFAGTRWPCDELWNQRTAGSQPFRRKLCRGHSQDLCPGPLRTRSEFSPALRTEKMHAVEIFFFFNHWWQDKGNEITNRAINFHKLTFWKN